MVYCELTPDGNFHDTHGVKFSMIFEAQLADPTPERERQTIHDCVEQAVFAEQVGFDGIWAVEHHSLKWYAHMSAPEIFLTYIAAKTTRIRIGHGVVLMPFKFNHPARVAERAAMLDVLSNGRVNLGGGRGATAQEMSLCQVDVDDTYPQVEETFKMISQMWRKDDFEWHGSKGQWKPFTQASGTPYRPVIRSQRPMYCAPPAVGARSCEREALRLISKKTSTYV